MPNEDVDNVNDRVGPTSPHPQSSSPSSSHLLEASDNEEQIKRIKKRGGLMFRLKGKQASGSSGTGEGNNNNTNSGEDQTGNAQGPALRGLFRFGLGVFSERGSLEA